jgi:transketolase
MLRCAYDVAERLGKEGMSVRLISMHTVKPLDDEAVVKAARETGAVFTLEEHSVIGGLGSAVAGVVAERAPGTTFKMFGIPDEFAKYVGTQAYLLSKYSLTADAISTEIARLIKAEGKR